MFCIEINNRAREIKIVSRNLKKAAECLGRQPNSNTWVTNEKIHIDLDGNLIPLHNQEYIWLGSLVGNRKLTSVALKSDAAVVTDDDPYETAYTTLRALKKAVSNNFVAAFTVLGAFGMAIHYDTVLDGYGMCPTPVLIGKKNTGKSTIALTALYMCGIPNFFLCGISPLLPHQILTVERHFLQCLMTQMK